jgi:hypothetical protein
MSIATLFRRLGRNSQSLSQVVVMARGPQKPADLRIENGKLLNLGDGHAFDVSVEVAGSVVAQLDVLSSGRQWERLIEPGAVVRWSDWDGTDHATTD